MSSCLQWWRVAKRSEKKKNIRKKKRKASLPCVCSEDGALCSHATVIIIVIVIVMLCCCPLLLLLLSMALLSQSLLLSPAIYRPHCVLSLPFVVPTIHLPQCSSPLPLVIFHLLLFVIPAVCCHLMVQSLSSFLGSIVISTTIFPCEQWLAGGVVVMCDVAPIAGLQAKSQWWCWVGGSIG